MAKKKQSAAKSKGGVDKVLNRVTNEFEKASSQIEKMVNDALKQIDNLQKQVQEPIKKLMDDVENVREREIKRLHTEFDKRMSEFQELQHSLMERVGISSETPKKASKAASQAKTKAKTAAKKSTSKANTAAKTTKTKAKSAQSSAKKTASKAKTQAKATASKAKQAATGSGDDLTRIKGVGPATAKKLNANGITKISQLANPSAADKDKLKDFQNNRSFASWQAEAKKLV